MTIDSPQRQQALDWQRSFIVQAPAGSGKTELLIQRYLVLLTKVEKYPEQVLAITFTKKAAQEMRARVLQALKRAQQPEPESAHQRVTWQLAREVLERDAKENWQLLQQPNRLVMQTIDGFCASLTRQMPLVSRFGAMPEIADNPYELYQQAAEQVWLELSKETQWKKSVRRLLYHFDNNLPRLQRLIAELLGKREQWLDYINAIDDSHQIAATLKSHLQHLVEDVLQEAWDNFPDLLKTRCIDLIAFAAGQCQQNQINRPHFQAALSLIELPEPTAEHLSSWQAIANFCLTTDGSVRKRVDRSIGFLPKSEGKTQDEKNEFAWQKETMQNFLLELAKYPSLVKALQHIQQLPPAHYETEQQQILVDFLEVLALAAAQLLVIFQQNGTCDFNQLLQGALTALGMPLQPTDLALVMDYRLQHILVDEFQDTSVAQFRLLERLIAGWNDGDGRTLFLVGDPMQSIYRFRQAEVGLFLTAWEKGIGDIQLTPLVLKTNFRSARTIVDWINQHMQQAFPAVVDVGIGAVPFTSAVAHHDHLAEVTVHGALDDQAQAQCVLALLQQALQDPTQKEIAILVRARSHLVDILPILQRAGIAYQAVEIETLSNKPVLQDLLALTRALLHPADRIAWLAILRAPWCGLTLKELTHIVAINPQACIIDNLTLFAKEQPLSERTQTILPRFIHIMQTALAERQRLPAAQWITRVWLALQGPSCYQDETMADDVEKYFSLIESLGLELYHLLPDELESRVARLYATPIANARVQVMTMHKAKGLEFDTVIIPGLEAMNSSSERPLLAWWERPRQIGNAELLIAAVNEIGKPEDALYQYIWLQQKRATLLELTRLLYVAMTRAKRYLHLTAVVTVDEENKIEAPTANSLLKCIWESVRGQVVIKCAGSSRYCYSNNAVTITT